MSVVLIKPAITHSGADRLLEPEETGEMLSFVAGMSWVVEASAEYTPAELTAGGTFTTNAADRAPKETTYIIRDLLIIPFFFGRFTVSSQIR